MFLQQNIDLLKTINLTFNGIFLFSIGLFFSVFFGVMMMGSVRYLVDIIWYMFGICIPLIPSVLNMERWI